MASPFRSFPRSDHQNILSIYLATKSTGEHYEDKQKTEVTDSALNDLERP
jgi:hypothetical protein